MKTLALAVSMLMTIVTASATMSGAMGLRGAEEKLGKLERQLTDPRVELELAVEKNPAIADNHVAEATIWTRGPVLRAREASSDMP